MQKNIHLHYRGDIDGLRAIAVLSVIGFHAFPQWISGGFVGVDIFFVISGYLISSILFKTLNKGYFSFIDFYQKRIRRIFPALMIVLASCYIAGWFALLGSDFKSLGKHLAYGTGFLSNFILLDESGYFDAAAESKPFLHLWSLGIEEQFYALWPLLVVLTFRRKIIFLSLTIASIIISFSVGLITLYNDASSAFYLPQYRIWELLLGGLLAYYVVEKKEERFTQIAPIISANTRATIGLLLILIAIFLFDQKMDFPGWRALFPVIGTILIISAGNDAFINKHICAHPFLVFFGLISYPLYLWHWPVLVFIKLTTQTTLSALATCLAILTSILLAYITYQTVERPIKKTSSTAIIVLLIIASIISAVGFWTYKQDGLTFRFPAEIQYLSDSNNIQKNNTLIEQSYRRDSCFLLAADRKSFADECVDSDFKTNSHSLLLWGDSHAAMHYNGIVNMKNSMPFTLAQYTVASCGPFLKPRKEFLCPERTNFIIKKITELKPNIVILSARWETFHLPDLPSTFAFLQKAGVKHIIVIGMVPIWDDPAGLPAILVKEFTKNIPHTIPERITLKHYPALLSTDTNLKNITESNGAIYISSLDAFCNDEGCLTKQGNDILDLTTLDYGHLTPSASIYLTNKTLKPILNKLWEMESN